MEKMAWETKIFEAQVHFRNVQNSSISCSTTTDSNKWNCSAYYRDSIYWRFMGGSVCYQDSDSIQRIPGISDEIFFWESVYFIIFYMFDLIVVTDDTTNVTNQIFGLNPLRLGRHCKP